MDNLSEFLATEVMGWLASRESPIVKAVYFNPKKYDQNLASDEQGYEFLIEDWNPRENIEQAMMCLKVVATKGAHIYYHVDHWQVKICFPFAEIFGTGETESEAISLACARARGFDK